MNATTTAPAAKIAKQNVVAVSATAKQFISDSTADFIAPSKSKPEGMNASEREIVDGLVLFAEKNRYVTRPVAITEKDEETGELIETGDFEDVEFDLLDEAMQEVMAERMETTRVNGSTVKLKAAESEIEALRAELAKLRGE